MKAQKHFPVEFYELAQMLMKRPKDIQCFAFATREEAEQARFRWYNFKKVVAAKALQEDETFRALDVALTDFELIMAPADGHAEHRRGRYSGLRYKSLPQDLRDAWRASELRRTLVNYAGIQEDTMWGLFFRPRSLSPLAQVFATVTKGFIDEETKALMDKFNEPHQTATAETTRKLQEIYPPKPKQEEPQEEQKKPQEELPQYKYVPSYEPPKPQGETLEEVARAIVDGDIKWPGEMPKALKQEVERLQNLKPEPKQEPKP